MKKYIVSLCLGLLCACSTDDTPQIPTQPSGGWLPVVSRADGTTATTDYLIALRYGSEVQTGTLQVTGDASLWKNNFIPAWPTDNNTDVEVIALHPAQEALPTELSDDHTWQMHYSTAKSDAKPDKFILKHLMAQLKVHILIQEKQEHTPKNGKILLRRKGTIEYQVDDEGKNASRLNADCFTPESVELGNFIKQTGDGTNTQSSDWHDDDFESAALIVVPQTFPAGEECLTFQVEDVIYVFNPEKPITITPGKVNVLNLGIIYNEPQQGESGTGATGSEIPKVLLEGITVTDWTSTDINGGEAEEV